ncbi:MAG: hypothetical protein ABS54_17300 [Hyphomicrobium sp. SCN 65-11]|nr:MAG: hypothetical protein ABS54_17300 [Hyphomicrobium sp. SCN 65-11]
MDRIALDVNDRREGTEAAPGSAQRVIADLEAVDKKLVLASTGAGSTAEIEVARTLLRGAITALTRFASAELGTGKQRVKIKAESEVAATDVSAAAGASAPAKPGSASTKPAARGARNQDGARGRRPAPTEKVPAGSLIARLGAAVPEGLPPASADPERPAIIEAAKPIKSAAPLSDTAERLAQLEAEIADLTEAVTATPSRPAPSEAGAVASTATAAPAAVTAAASTAKGNEPDFDSDDEDAEITITGPDGASPEPTANASRQSPRIFREGPPSYEEEAEVEIHGSGPMPSSARTTERPGTVRVSARTSMGGLKGGALGKWRLFRGS